MHAAPACSPLTPAHKVFDCFSYQPKRVLTGHTGSVLSLKVQDGQLITGATDNVIKVWQL